MHELTVSDLKGYRVLVGVGYCFAWQVTHPSGLVTSHLCKPLLHICWSKNVVKISPTQFSTQIAPPSHAGQSPPPSPLTLAYPNPNTSALLIDNTPLCSIHESWVSMAVYFWSIAPIFTFSTPKQYLDQHGIHTGDPEVISWSGTCGWRPSSTLRKLYWLHWANLFSFCFMSILDSMYL